MATCCTTSSIDSTGASYSKTLHSVLSKGIYKIIAIFSGLVYWVIYEFSSGMLFYYPVDVFAYLKQSPVPNPLIYLDTSSFKNFYLSGLIWYPNGHFEIVLAIGPLVFSVILSLLFSFNIAVMIYSFKFIKFNRKTGISGILGLIPAVFSGGCCSIPVGFSILGAFIPLATLRPLLYFSFAYTEYINTFFALLLLFSLYYLLSKIRRFQISNSV